MGKRPAAGAADRFRLGCNIAANVRVFGGQFSAVLMNVHDRPYLLDDGWRWKWHPMCRVYVRLISVSPTAPRTPITDCVYQIVELFGCSVIHSVMLSRSEMMIVRLEDQDSPAILWRGLYGLPHLRPVPLIRATDRGRAYRFAFRRGSPPQPYWLGWVFRVEVVLLHFGKPVTHKSV